MNFFSELCRRNVIRVAAVYAATCWLLLQIADLVIENISAPSWMMPAFMLVAAIGFPVVIIAAWMVELTLNGFKLVKNVDPANSISSQTGHQLMRGFIMILSMAVVLYLTDRFRHETWFAPKAENTEFENTGSDEQNE